MSLRILPDPRVSASPDRGRAALRATLVCLDLVGCFASWAVVFSLTHHATQYLPLQALALTLLTTVLIGMHKLYRARVCAVRSVEVGRLASSALICALAATCFNQAEHQGPSPTAAILGAAGSFVVLALLRTGYDGWLRACRSRGLFCRPICILGDNEEAAFLVELVESEPEMGYRVVGVIGDAKRWDSRGTGIPCYPTDRSPVEAARRSGASSVLVATSAVEQPELDRLVRELLASGFHVQISSGTTRIGHQRMRANPLSHHLLFYVERCGLSSWQRLAKRMLDIVVASAALIVASPAVAAAAIAIKLDDGGPVFFRQERVGRLHKTFPLVKLRTMVPDASSRLADLVGDNERTGPLFKLSFDPRVTRVGRFLRASSIDEIPQLWNVLKGEMSLVGPRPALPTEVVQFDDDLMERASVLPGITGLWQVEARDNPSFYTYRRLDLFYIDNWSVMLDLTILCATALVVAARALRVLRRKGEMAVRSPAPTCDLTSLATEAVGDPVA